MLKTVSLWLMALFYVAAGLNHFRDPAIYLQLMPSYLPWPRALIFVSGVAEVLGGIGVLVPATRRLAGWALVALLIAVFPANLHAARHGFHGLPEWVLWTRLPGQILLIAWVYWTCLKKS
jgi:uncharacterized membrane protein